MKRKIKNALKTVLRIAVFYAICLALGAGLGIYAGQHLRSDGQVYALIAYALVMLYLTAAVQIVLHEGGHLLFGLMTGYRLISFNVFGFVFAKGEDGKVHVRRSLLAGTAGQCLMAPPPLNGGDFPVTLYNMGGVIVNGASAILFALLAALVYHVPAAFIPLATLSLLGLLFALTNGVPLTTTVQNDGSNQRSIQARPEARRALWLQLAIAAEMARGVRLKDMPEDWFAPFPEEAMNNALVTTIAALGCNRLLDAEDLPAAEEAIRALLAHEKGVMPLHRVALLCDGAVCELLAGRPADMTAALSTKEHRKLLQAMRKAPSVLRTQYALALLQEKDEAKAMKHLSLFEKFAAKHPYPQEIVSERALIARIDAAREADA